MNGLNQMAIALTAITLFTNIFYSVFVLNGYLFSQRVNVLLIISNFLYIVINLVILYEEGGMK